MRRNRLLLAAATAACLAAPLAGQEEPARPLDEPPAEAEPEASRGPRLRFGVEVKAAFRDSDANAFRTSFSTGGGAPVRLSTVDPGTSLEVPGASLFVDAAWGETLLELGDQAGARGVLERALGARPADPAAIDAARRAAAAAGDARAAQALAARAELLDPASLACSSR